jgi:16S rRNA (guanine(1405)-N(7))-methyltransferase
MPNPLDLDQKIQETIASVLKSKNYSNLNPELVRDVVLDFIPKYPAKILLKEVKNKLHQVWGAFWDGTPNFEKILDKLQKASSDQEKREILIQIAKLHTSTAERLSILPSFYNQIFNVCQGASSVVEYGCGLNSISLLLSSFGSNMKYIGYDIDQNEVDFLNQLFQIQGFDSSFKAKCASIFNQDLTTDKSLEVVFLFKLLTTLEQQQKGISLKILNNLPQKWIVVTFPVFSIGRKSKNMTEFYTKWFEELLTKLEFQVNITKLEFITELVFVIEKL